MRKEIEVAVGLLVFPERRVLMGLRPAFKARPGMWEYPGGKVERGELIIDTVKREWREELDVGVVTARWLNTVHFELDVDAWIHLYKIDKMVGRPKPMEKQELLHVDPFEAVNNLAMVPSCYLFYQHVIVNLHPTVIVEK